MKNVLNIAVTTQILISCASSTIPDSLTGERANSSDDVRMISESCRVETEVDQNSCPNVEDLVAGVEGGNGIPNPFAKE